MEAIDLSAVVLLTLVVLGVLLVVLAVIAVVVLLPHVRRALADRAQRSETEVDAKPADSQPANGNRAEPEQR